MKKIILIICLVFSFFMISNQNTFAKDGKIFWQEEEIPYCKGNDCSLKKWINEVKWKVDDIYYDNNKWFSGYIQDIIAYVLTFLYFITVVIIIYAWFNMLTASWDEEKAAKSKKIIIYAITWLIIIYLAWPITNFVLDMFNQAK